MSNGDSGGGRIDGVTAIAQHVTRPLVTMLFAGTFCYGFLIGRINGEIFTTVVGMVMTFWFVQRGQEQRATDLAKAAPAAATVSIPPAGGTATATVTSPEKDPAH